MSVIGVQNVWMGGGWVGSALSSFLGIFFNFAKPLSSDSVALFFTVSNLILYPTIAHKNTNESLDIPTHASLIIGPDTMSIHP